MYSLCIGKVYPIPVITVNACQYVWCIVITYYYTHRRIHLSLCMLNLCSNKNIITQWTNWSVLTCIILTCTILTNPGQVSGFDVKSIYKKLFSLYLFICIQRNASYVRKGVWDTISMYMGYSYKAYRGWYEYLLLYTGIAYSITQ